MARANRPSAPTGGEGRDCQDGIGLLIGDQPHFREGDGDGAPVGVSLLNDQQVRLLSQDVLNEVDFPLGIGHFGDRSIGPPLDLRERPLDLGLLVDQDPGRAADLVPPGPARVPFC